MAKTLFIRHLQEIDDLKLYGRDAPLNYSIDDKSKINELANKILININLNSNKAVLFITSPKIRAIQTAELISEQLKIKNSTLKIRFTQNENLISTNQGNFILPNDYKAGEVFEGLKYASHVFDLETHASDFSNLSDNIDYKFGDPILLKNGKFKYPKLLGIFNEYGESYKETLIRIYTLIQNWSAKNLKSKSTEIIIIAHGQIYHLLRGLIKISETFIANKFTTGDSVKLLWEIYKSCSNDEKIPGICNALNTDYFLNQKQIELLNDEINYLKHV